MPEFYHNIITEKSFKILQELKKKFKFILIGGWAVFLYSHALKSKDIDIILDYEELGNFKKEFEVFKNERLKKYEVKKEETDIDIYLPHYSNIGFPVEEIKNNCQSLEGFLVPPPEVLLILKTFALKERADAIKGKKDLIDIFSLFKEDKVDWRNYKELIKKHNLEEIDLYLKKAVGGATAIPELDLLNHKMSKLKKQILESLS